METVRSSHEMPSSIRTLASVCVSALALAFAATGALAEDVPAPPPLPADPPAAGTPARFKPPSRTRAYVAKLVIGTTARSRPAGGTRVARVETTTVWTGRPTRLLVLDSKWASDGRVWLKVQLPFRPNGSAGWIPRDLVRISVTPYRIVILRDRRLLSVFRGGNLIGRWRVVVGAPETPTPKGLYAIYEKAKQPSPDDFIGPWALHLTAHSEVLDNYGGGPGRVALHGRGGQSLLDPLGTARSHGCVRMNNAQVQFLAHDVPAGTPVEIR